MAIKEEIRNELGKARTGKAIEKLMAFLKGKDEDLYNQAVMLKSQFESTERENSMGLIASSEHGRNVSKINFSLLNLVDKAEEYDDNAAAGTEPAQPSETKSNTINIGGSGNVVVQDVTDSVVSVNEGGDSANKTTILFLYASPQNKTELRFTEETRSIANALEIGERQKSFAFEALGAVQADEVTPLLRKYKPEILHISLHSSKKDGLLFEDKNRQKFPMSVEDFGILIKRHQRREKNLKCVVVNACNSIEHAKAASNYIDFAVGMQDFIPDEAAVPFTKAFYNTFFDEQNFEYAYEDGIDAVRLAKIEQGDLDYPAHEIPVLLKKEK